MILICYYSNQTIPSNQAQSVLKPVAEFKSTISGEFHAEMASLVTAEIFSSNLTNNEKPLLPGFLSSKFKYVKQLVIPPEVYDKKAPFYGMVYKDIYGLPMAAITNESFDEEVTESWAHYFPSLMSAIENDNKLNPTHNPTYFTKSSVISLSKHIYTLNDEFEATITSLDGEGRKKTLGQIITAQD